ASPSKKSARKASREFNLLRLEARAVVGQIEMAHVRADGHDAGRVHIALAVVTRLGFSQIESVANPRPLVELAQIVAEIRITLPAAQVALEVAAINRIEAQQGRKRAPVGFGDAPARQIEPLAQPLFHAIETQKNFLHRFVVSFLAAREA